MRELHYWNTAADDQSRRAQAKILANQIDNTFIELRKADYSTGIDKAAARYMLESCLMQMNLTLSELAEKVNEYYLFRGEKQ